VGDATYEIKSSTETDERAAVGASPLHGRHDSGGEWDQEAAKTQQCWVTETLCEITLGRRWLEEQPLILLLAQRVGDLSAQICTVT